MIDWLRLATRRDIVIRSLRVAALVGTVLVLINQGDTLLRGGPAALNGWKVLLTYFVPYAVATYAGVAAMRDSDASGR